MTDSKKLRDKIEGAGLKYSFLAKKLGLSSYGLQKKIENDTEFKASEVKSLADLLNLSTIERDEIFFA